MKSILLPAFLLSLRAMAQDAPAPAPVEDYKPTKPIFVIGGVVPKDVAYEPLTQKQLWKLYTNENYGWKNGAYFRAVGAALPNFLRNRPPQWGQGVEGYARHTGNVFATFTITSTLQYAGQSAIGHDPRYVACKCSGFWNRLGHSTLMSVATYNRSGKKVFNVMNLAGAAGGEAIAATWYPGANPGVRAYQGVATQVGFGVFFNVIREFGPEIKRAFKRTK